MKKFLKFALYGIGGLIALLLLAVAIIAATFNPNDYKDDVIKVVKEKKDRTLKIDGDIKLSYWPKIGADLGRVSISEHKNEAEFASVNSVKVALAVMPLLKKELVVDTIYVDGAKANIIKYKDGSSNFDDLLSKDESESQTVKFDVDGVHVTNSEVNYTDEATGVKYNVSKLNLSSGHIALAEPVDLETDFMLTANQPAIAANTKLKGNFLIDPATKHFKVKGLDSHVTGDMLGGKSLDIKVSGDVDAKPEQMEFLVDGLKLVASGNFEGAKNAIDLSAPALTIEKDEVSSKKVTVSLSQEKAGDVLKANMVLADMKGSPKSLQSSGITGDLSAVQGKRTITGTFSSPFTGNIENLIFDLPKLAGNLDIKDPSLPNGGMKGSFNLGAHTEIKNEIAKSQFNLTIDGVTKLNGDVDVAGFKKSNIKFNLNADQLDLNKLLVKSAASAKPANDKPADMSALNNMTIDGKLNVGSIAYDKYRISGLNVGVKADGDKLALSGLNFKVDNSQIKGSVGITHFSKPLYTFDLDIDQLDVDKYVAASPADKKASNKPTDLSALKALNADGVLRIGKFKYGKTNASNIVINLKADGQKLALSPFSGKVDDSQIKGSFAISQFERPAYAFDLDIDRVDVNKYVTASTSNAQKSEQPADLSALKTLLADGSLRVGSLKYEQYQVSNLKFSLKADGQKLQLNQLVVKLDDSQINANIGITQFTNPTYNFDVNVDKLDADKYIAKGHSESKGAGDTPIDLSALKKLNATGEAKIGWLKLANVKTQNVNLGLKADNGIATLAPFSANLYQGSMAGALTVDARNTPSIIFKQTMKGVSVGPLMVDAIKNDMLSGTGTVNVDVATQGNTVGALKKGLAGNASLSLADGALKGVDIAGSIRELKNKVNILKAKDASADQSKKTDFSELTATFNIKNGVARNEDLAMKAPILRLAKGDSRGDIDIGNEKINYLAKPTIVKSLKGQGGADLDNLAGIAIPLKISGTFAEPKYSLDFAAVGSALAKSNLLDKVGGEKGAMAKELLGNENKADAISNILNKKKSTETPSASGTEAQSAAEEKPKSLEDQAKEKAEKKLKKLLKF
ncbi:MAG TPA: AsmA family protein [Methylotenera sp.]|nr:AsmA family protein [Methylotenera sp.]HPH04593.1 AsmA family protein [Methylotenera sp.]HPN00732.1 AsmA family protein [Methylotenera sp.]